MGNVAMIHVMTVLDTVTTEWGFKAVCNVELSLFSGWLAADWLIVSLLNSLPTKTGIYQIKF